MKVQDLKQYKPLDITQLPAEKWNTAEKVLGLDENDKVVMAEPEEVVTPEYVDNAIDQAMEAETARTESTYLKEHQSLDDYATKQYVDDAISEIDLSDYYTKEEVDEAIENVDVSDQLVNYAKTTAVTQDIQTAIASETARTEDVYAKKSELPDLDNYYTKSETDEAIEEAISGISLEGYWTSAQTKNYVDAEITGATASETARTESTYAKKSEIPSLDGYATEDWVESQGYLTEHQSLDGYAKTTAVTQDIQSAIASETARTEDTYAKKSDIPDLDNYYTKAQTDAAITAATDDMATETWVQNQGYLTQHQDISGKLDVSTFNTYTGATETVLEGKADLSDIPDVSDFVTSGDVATQIGTAMAAETARTEETYAKIGDVPEVDLNPVFPRMPWFTLDNGGQVLEYVKSAIFDTYVPDGSEEPENCSQIWLLNTAFDLLDNNVSDDWGEFGPQFTIDPVEKVAYVENIPAGNYIFGLSKFKAGDNYDPEFEINYWSKDSNGWEPYTVEDGTSEIWDNSDFSIDDYWRKFDGNVVLTNNDEWYNWSFPKDVERFEISIKEVPGVGDEYLEINITYKEYATEAWVEDQGYLTEHQDISGKLDVNVFTGYTGTTETALSGKVDKTDFNTYTGATETVLNGKADVSDIPDVSGFVTSGDVETQIGTAMASETGRTEDAYVKKNLYDGENENSLTKIRKGVYNAGNQHYDTLSYNYVVPKTGGQGGGIGTLIKKINGQSIIGDIAGFGDESISLPTFNDVSTAITDSMATETARTESTYVKSSELGNYATKEYVDKNLSGYTETRTVEIGDVSNNVSIVVFNTPQGDKTVYFSGTNVDNIYVLRHSDIGGQEEFANLYIDGVRYYPTTGGTPEMSIPAEVPATGAVFEISTTVREVGWYYADSTSPEYFIIDTDALTASFTSTLPTYTLTVPGKQDTLVSGTNIKTINNQSLLGSGNIDIQGGGGGGSVVELTQAQYEALDPPAADTTYIITDAETVDLNDYAMASGLTELSGTVTTINSNYATKQSVTARESNSNYLPGWNAQGVITGSTAYYNKSQGINGTNYNVFSNSNTNHPAIFAPTSAGTAGQPLLSNGSGAPVWGQFSFQFISQSAYDALTTKDSSTIYFVVDPS